MFTNNRFDEFETTGERALKGCHRLKLDLWKREDGQIAAEWELHGSTGSLFDDDDDEGGVKEPVDLSLLTELLTRFQGT